MRNKLMLILIFCLTLVILQGCGKNLTDTIVFESESTSTVDPSGSIENENMTESPTEDVSSVPTEPVFFTNDYGTYRKVNEQVLTEGNVFLRSCPNGEKVTSVNVNVTLTRVGIGEDNGWSIVLYKGEEVYVVTYYVTPVEPAQYKEVEETVYTTEQVNYRNGPSIRARSLGKFPENSVLTRVGVGNDGWSKIRYNDEIVYVCSQYLKIKEDISELETSENTEPLETEPTSETPTNGIDSYEQDGVVYEIVDEQVEATRNVNIRKEPNSSSERVGKLLKGNTIQRIAIGNNGWSKVVYNGEEVYIYSDYLLKR